MNMFRDRAFESLLLENYSSFILTIECKKEFTLQGPLSEHKKETFTVKRETPISVRLHFRYISLRHASFSMYISQMLF